MRTLSNQSPAPRHNAAQFSRSIEKARNEPTPNPIQFTPPAIWPNPPKPAITCHAKPFRQNEATCHSDIPQPFTRPKTRQCKTNRYYRVFVKGCFYFFYDKGLLVSGQMLLDRCIFSLLHFLAIGPGLSAWDLPVDFHQRRRR
jgi:hypothetical protein